jgi:hypothetical protein
MNECTVLGIKIRALHARPGVVLPLKACMDVCAWVLVYMDVWMHGCM